MQILELTLLTGALSFTVSYLATPRIAKQFLRHGITGFDVHKVNRRSCAEMGGVSVMLGFIAGVTILLAFNPISENLIIAGIATIMFTFAIGVLDDLFELRQRFKTLLIAAAATPMVLAYAGSGSLWLPIINDLNLGMLYPLILIPLAMTTSANFANMLAGFNGLETGISVIALSTMGLLSFATNHWMAGLIALALTAAFAAFLKYNWYPAKVFPGDSGTLLSGVSVAAIGVMAQLEFAAILVSVPAAFDFTLKMLHRRPFSQRSEYGNTKVGADGILNPAPYPALSHAFLRVSRMNEKHLVITLLSMEAIYALLAVIITLTLR